MRWFSVALLLLCAASLGAGASSRKVQVYVQPGEYFTAETVWNLSLEADDSLYDVVMYYDVEMDEYSGGLVNPWDPPSVYLLLPDYWKLFLDAKSCLGLAGPLGPYGPLSTWGAVGNQMWNPSALPLVYFGNDTVSCEWCSVFSSFIEGWFHTDGDPLGPNGPLGYRGPLTKKAIYNDMYHLNELFWNANDFAQALDIQGPWAVLGPLGPLGALGILGPLGPNGPHMYTTVDPATGTRDGQFRNSSGVVQREIRVVYDQESAPTHRVYRLAEFYPESTAVALGQAGDGDASFVVQGSLSPITERDSYRFTSRFNQSIAVVAFPVTIEPPGSYEEVLSDINVSIGVCPSAVTGPCTTVVVSQSKTPSAVFPVSELYGYADFAVFVAESGRTYEVSVWARDTTGSGHYRVTVTGSGFLEGPFQKETDRNVFNHSNFEGEYRSSF